MTTARPTSWTAAWPDALAFVIGLGAARLGGWTTTDLVWSLWLSSLVVGYAMIVRRIVRPVLAVARGVSRDRALVGAVAAERGAAPLVVGGSVVLLGAAFMLAFFTVHFGGFHVVHSQFLAIFFPLDPMAPRTMVGLETYAEVARRYWPFLPAAFLAERAAFLEPEDAGRGAAAGPAAAHTMRDGMTAPYRNVVRMHLLIFFFAFASFASLDHAAVYAVVYAVYFFPWRLVRRG